MDMIPLLRQGKTRKDEAFKHFRFLVHPSSEAGLVDGSWELWCIKVEEIEIPESKRCAGY